jgi:hypothetical protein
MILKDLRFVIPEDDFELNLLIVLLVVHYLNATSRGNHILDIERLNFYVYLLKNPHILYKLLIRLGKKSFLLKSYEVSSYKSENNNSEILYDNKMLRYYVQVLTSNNLINIAYNEKIGFIFTPTEDTEKYISVDSKYFKRSISLIEKIKQMNSTTVSKINTEIKNILQEGK